MRVPDKKGHFGIFGGKFVPETLIPALEELEREYSKARRDLSFQKELAYLLRDYAGRPTPLYFAKNLSKYLKTCKVYLKREDLLHTGAHKINNTLGQVLLARRMGKKRIIAETGAGQHGVATATVAALLGLKCAVYMGKEDIHRQQLNVYRMRLLGAEVIPVTAGAMTLKEACSEAIRDWVTNVKTTHYIIGSVVGPHPYPMIVRDFQCCIGKETKKQIIEREGRFPDYLVACVGGGSNSIGLFYPFINESKIRIIGVEAAGVGLNSNKTAASLVKGKIGILHGSKSFVLQNKDGQISVAHSIAAGLDYPGVGPEHSFLKEVGRIEYKAVSDKQALAGFYLLSRLEGIIPALEPAHAIAYLMDLAPKIKKGSIVVLCLSGRGDKDVALVSSIDDFNFKINK